MGLKERILAKQESEKEANRLRVLPQAQAYNNGLDDAAQLAAETDALMAEMVSALAGLDPSQLTDDQALNLTGVLDRYNQYKDKTND